LEELLVVGEMDTNVDPSSTMQVVSKLIKANKDFDLLVVPGANHNAARGDRYATYGAHKQYDFFVRHLLDVNPPPWNKAAAAGTTQSAR
jgi:dipeptidyl aminopeptidase/acylaminoacyl peptidase